MLNSGDKILVRGKDAYFIAFTNGLVVYTEDKVKLKVGTIGEVQLIQEEYPKEIVNNSKPQKPIQKKGFNHRPSINTTVVTNDREESLE